MSEGLAAWGDETIRLLREANEVLHNANEEAMSDTPRTDALCRSMKDQIGLVSTTDHLERFVRWSSQLERQNAELLEALRAMVNCKSARTSPERWITVIARANAAIAKASA